MEPSFRLGRIAGITVGVNWSVFVIAGLIGWSLADGVLPDAAPGYSDVAYASAGVLAAVVFFGGLLAHELSHSIVARGRGVAVKSITLWLFGGVARLKGEAASPEDELRIAIAGPVMSIGLAAAFGVLATAADALRGPDLAVAALLWLSGINILLALFNLIPAAPLDGGRVLHALVWRRSGSHGYATHVATRTGQQFGYLMIGGGVLLFLLGDLTAIWFMFLGWFLLMAARAEATHELLTGALSHLHVRDIMTTDPIVVPEDMLLPELVDEWFLHHRCSAFPVADASGRVTGLVTLQRVRAIHSDARSGMRVRDIAQPVGQVPRVAPDDEIPALLEAVAAAPGRDGRALVFEGEHLVGIVTSTDIRRALDVAALREQRRDAPSPSAYHDR